jgi:hypothetical protein
MNDENKSQWGGIDQPSNWDPNHNRPAFPANHFDMAEGEHGLTMRDYFAAKAMQGLISCPDWRENAGEDVGMDASDYTAGAAYMMADAMLKARDQ